MKTKQIVMQLNKRLVSIQLLTLLLKLKSLIDSSAKYPDVSPTDFCPFDVLKRALNNRIHKSINELRKAMEEE